jgi:4'-phosphopantetheinyl transferase EntD
MATARSARFIEVDPNDKIATTVKILSSLAANFPKRRAQRLWEFLAGRAPARRYTCRPEGD